LLPVVPIATGRLTKLIVAITESITPHKNHPDPKNQSTRPNQTGQTTIGSPLTHPYEPLDGIFPSTRPTSYLAWFLTDLVKQDSPLRVLHHSLTFSPVSLQYNEVLTVPDQDPDRDRDLDGILQASAPITETVSNSTFSSFHHQTSDKTKNFTS